MSERLVDIYAKFPWWLQNVACSVVGYQIKQQRYGQRFADYLEDFRRTEWSPRAELEALQKERLSHICRIAGLNVPYYRELFERVDFDPCDFSVDEYREKIPILTKQDVRRNYEALQNEAFPANEIQRVNTSGSTGTSLRLHHTPSHHAAQWAIWWRHRMRFGLNVGDKYANFAGQSVIPRSPMQMPTWRRNLPMNQTYFSLFAMTDEFLPEIYEYLNSHRYDYFSGYPSALMALATYMNERGLKLDNPPRAVATGAESLFAFHREAFTRAFGARVIDQYGLSEGVANISQCEFGGYHVDMDFAFVEFLPLSDEQPDICQIIGTNFFNEAMPLLRYDTGDVATLSDETCRCGRELTLVDGIDGRVESIIHTPDGRHVGRLDYIFKDSHEVLEAQMEQPELSRLILRVVKTDRYGAKDEQKLREKVHSYLGDAIQVEFEYVSGIPREANGKFRGIISKL